MYLESSAKMVYLGEAAVAPYLDHCLSSQIQPCRGRTGTGKVYRPTHQGSQKPPTPNVATQRYKVHKGATHIRGLPDYSTELLIALL